MGVKVDRIEIKEILDLKGCIVVFINLSLTRDNSEIYIAKRPMDLSSSSVGLEFGNTASFSNFIVGVTVVGIVLLLYPYYNLIQLPQIRSILPILHLRLHQSNLSLSVVQ